VRLDAFHRHQLSRLMGADVRLVEAGFGIGFGGQPALSAYAAVVR
jgi:hypothetical protein